MPAAREGDIHLPFSLVPVSILLRLDVQTEISVEANDMTLSLIQMTLAASLAGFVAPQSDLRGLSADVYEIAMASDCSRAVSQVIGETGGQLLSVEPSGDGNSCVVTVLVTGNGERPRKVTVRVQI